eukprot:4070803-Heterocapsa_arctica.AAC.1
MEDRRIDRKEMIMLRPRPSVRVASQRARIGPRDEHVKMPVNKYARLFWLLTGKILMRLAFSLSCSHNSRV